MSGRSPPLYCTLMLITMHSHQSYPNITCLVSLHGDECSVQHNSGFLPDIILLTQRYTGTRLNATKRFCLVQPIILPKRFDNFPPDWGMLSKSKCAHIFLEDTKFAPVSHIKRIGTRCIVQAVLKKCYTYGCTVTCTEPLL